MASRLKPGRRESGSARQPRLAALVLRSQSDARLVELVRNGHDQAFVVIAERYRRELLAHARQVASPDQAEDVIQQALLSGWTALRGPGPEVNDLRAWLHRIVHNAALRSRHQLPDHHELSDQVPGMAGAAHQAEERLEARAAIAAVAGLPEAQRRAVELTALQGRSGREAAGTLGISEGALRQLVRRARASMRASVSALTPMPLLSWAISGSGADAPGRIAELGAGAGAGSLAVKTVATVAATATLIGGAAHVLSRPDHDAAPRPHHRTTIARAATPPARSRGADPGDALPVAAVLPMPVARAVPPATADRYAASSDHGSNDARDESASAAGGSDRDWADPGIETGGDAPASGSRDQTDQDTTSRDNSGSDDRSGDPGSASATPAAGSNNYESADRAQAPTSSSAYPTASGYPTAESARAPGTDGQPTSGPQAQPADSGGGQASDSGAGAPSPSGGDSGS